MFLPFETGLPFSSALPNGCDVSNSFLFVSLGLEAFCTSAHFLGILSSVY